MATSRRMLTEKEIKALGGGGGSMETVDTIISIDDGFKVTYADGSNLDLPLKAGSGISMDVSEDNYSIEIKAEGGSGGGGLYRHTVLLYDSPDTQRIPTNHFVITNTNSTPVSYDDIYSATIFNKNIVLNDAENGIIIYYNLNMPFISEATITNSTTTRTLDFSLFDENWTIVDNVTEL